jgi:hypothetical protein
MLRRSALGAAIAAAVMWCAGAASAAAPTERLVFTPFAPDGSLRPSLKVTTHTGGRCDTGSYVVARRGVHRCFDGNVIRDPCFTDAAASTASGEPVVVCVESPWSTAAVSLHLDEEPSSAGQAAPGRAPWALQLADGQRCVFAEGASNVVHGRRLNYFCTGKRYLFGTPRTLSPTWRIRMARSFSGRGWRLVAIVRAWR